MASKLTPQKLLEAVKKKHGDEAAVLLGGSRAVSRPVCPTGLEVLDHWVLGVGGFPYGRIVEVYGPEGGGKTSVMNRALAGVQKDGGIAVLAETEHKYDPEWAKVHGVNVDEVVLLQPTHLEQAVAEIETIVDGSGSRPVLVALDSVAATPTHNELEEGVSSNAMAEAARVWSKSMRILCGKLDRHKVGLILINQMRTKVGVVFGNPHYSSGGSAIKFHSIARLEVSPGKRIEDDKFEGRYVNVKASKNQMTPPFRSCQLKLSFRHGFVDNGWSVLNLAKDRKLVDARCRDVDEARAALGWVGVE